MKYLTEARVWDEIIRDAVKYRALRERVICDAVEHRTLEQIYYEAGYRAGVRDSSQHET